MSPKKGKVVLEKGCFTWKTKYMRLKLLSCEIFFREICHLAASATNIIDLEFLPKGLHDLGAERMQMRLQERIDAVDESMYDAVLLGFGLCNNGVAGLVARGLSLVIPRGHDCITLFLGSRDRYRQYFDAHPGTFYRTCGWYERENSEGTGEITVQDQMGLFQTHASLVEQYGEDNAKYIMETMGDPMAHYDRIAFIRMGLPGSIEDTMRDRSEQEARDKGWTLDELAGSLDLMRKLLEGPWGDDFLVVKPGETIAPSHDDCILKTCPCCEQ